jgi:NitT/TauT family transport system substrate-binding protein
MDAMLSGAIDIATPVETGPMFAIANGSDLAILAQVSTNAEEVKPAVRVDAGVSAPTDLKGKRLGYGAGSSNQFAMYNWLKAGNIPASEVTLVNLQPADLVTALIGGSIDVAFTWEPFLSAALKKSNGTVKIIEGQNLYRSRLLLVAKPVWTKANTDTVSKVAAALAMAADWMRSNKSEAVQITAQAIGMDPAELSSIFDRWSFDVELTKGLIQSFNDQFAWASQANLLPPGTKKPDFSKSFFPDGLKAVRAQAIDY